MWQRPVRFYGKESLIPSVLFILIINVTTCMAQVSIIHNINGYTYDADRDTLGTFVAMAFAGGKVIRVAQSQRESSLLKETYPDARMIDGEGATLLPGMIDAHGHVLPLGEARLNVDLSGARSLEEVKRKVAAYAERNPGLEWIVGFGWNQTRWATNSWPDASVLDAVVADRPVWLSRVDGHAGWANSRAMEKAGIDKDTKVPEGGEIVKDKQGRPTGIFVDKAMKLIENELSDKSKEQLSHQLDTALSAFAEVALTGVHDAGIDKQTFELFKSYADRGDLSVRIYAMIDGMGKNFEEMGKSGPVYSYADDLLSLRSVKLFADGALGSRGAAMLEDYSDDQGNNGLIFYGEEELTNLVEKAAGAGYQVNIHAIGDRANRLVLDAHENVMDSIDTRNLRHRIEHAQIVKPQDIGRFREMNIIASMQPTHATSDMNMAVDRIGEHRIDGAYAWSTMLDEGVKFAGGSDFPIESPNPFWGIHAAVTRQNHENEPAGGWYPSEKLSLYQAFKAFTYDAAYAAHSEDETGSLEPDKWADFILIDRDLFSMPEEDIWKIEVQETWLAGERVYERGQTKQH